MNAPLRPRVLVIVNSRNSGPRRLAIWLEEAGIDVIERVGDEGLPGTLDGFHGLVMLGGGFMPDDYGRAPWLSAERRLAEHAIGQDLPTLGICLGAQLIADVAGGEVRSCFGPKERGSTAIRPTAEGRCDPVLAELGEVAPMIENHQDMITALPPSAVLLASSDEVEHQAFRIGDHVRGVQFHPEACARDLSGWDDATLRDEGIDLAALIDAAEFDDEANTRSSRALVEAFAAEVRAGAELCGRAERIEIAERALTAAFESHPLHTAPAALAAVFDTDGVIAWKATGYPRYLGNSADRGTVFRIASMSKSFLAATALSLRDEGRVDLDSPLEAYLPGIRFLFDGHEQRVTVRQLLTNSSGLPEDNAWGDRRLADTREQVEELGRAGLMLAAEPGDRYQYSNLGMSFVGRAIERVTGRSIEAEITERFIEPLELTSTRWTPAEYPTDVSLAAGFRTFTDGADFVPEPYVGHGALACIGGLFSTVDDVARWANFLASAHSTEPQLPEVLSAASRREMQRPHTTASVGDPDSHRDLESFAYGMGLVVEQDRRFGRIVQHSGGLPGFSSHMRWHVATGIGVVAFGNSDVFGAARLATHALEDVLVDVGATCAAGPPWRETVEAGACIDRVICAGAPLAGLSGVLAPNVLQDVPVEVRQLHLAQALERVGTIVNPQLPIDARTIATADPSELRWRIDCEQGVLRCTIRLIGLHEPVVQRIDISAVEPAIS